jgi:outer membrane protein
MMAFSRHALRKVRLFSAAVLLLPHGWGMAQAQTIAAQPARAAACAGLQAADFAALTLPMVLDHALCASPVMRQAMSAVAERQAGVDLSQIAYRPRINAGASANATRVAPTPSTAGYSSQSLTGSLGLSWVLFDFGLRDANLTESRALLTSAMASLGNSQLNTVAETLRLYVEALSVWLRRDSLQQAELQAEQSVRVASAKYDVQVGSLAEKLQAQTALAQTTLERVRANGQWEAARAALAVNMGYSLTQKMAIPALVSAVPFLEDSTNIDDMLAYVRDNHPRLRALQAEIEAQQSRSSAIKAEGRGSVSVTANAQLGRRAEAAGNGFDRSAAAAVVANIPLFNQDEQAARLGQNEAQTNAKQSQLELAKRELETELLRQVLTIQTEIETRLAARGLLQAAEQSQQVAMGRYRGGVGTVADVLNAQSALTAARLALDQSYLAQASARLRLATVVGRLPVAPFVK